MSQNMLFYFSLTVAFPAAVGLFRFLKIERAYYPFLIYVLVSVCNELLARFILSHHSKESQILDWQLFNLFEALILCIQFYYWKVFKRFPYLFWGLLTFLVGEFVVENFLYSTPYAFNPIFLISYSFLLVLLCIQTINHIIVHQHRSPLNKNAMFIICVALIIIFIYNIFVFTLMAKGINRTNKLLMARVFEIRVYINAFTNILFGLAMLLVPRKISGDRFFHNLLPQADVK